MAEKKTFGFAWMKQSDILVALGVVLVVGMLIIPIPAWALDLAIAINLALSLGILLIVMYLSRGAELSVFPTLLLITTIFRLAINVSSTRLILLTGKNFDGQIIRAFGDFVVQNNYVVGFIVFLILIAVQFIVIIKGATRVSEVAARFTLDAMPGKQMSVDADLNAGLITEQEAIQRRKEIRQEVDFYGAMDGASKFVQGDVRVSLIITFINIIGGLIVGTTIQGLSFGQSFDIFFILTVGDGLSAQIPSLLLSSATGIIVTRAVSEQTLGQDIAEQLNMKPKAIIVTGGFILFLVFIPGFPKIPLLILGSGILAYGIFLNQRLGQAERSKLEEQTTPSGPESVVGLIQVEPIEIELGFNLIPFVDVQKGGDLLERVRLIRKTCALDLGLLVPPIRIRDNMRLKPNDYSIKIRGVQVGYASLMVKRLLGIPSPSVTQEIEGDDTVEPTFKTKAKWIDPENREKAENQGYSVVDPPSIIATHLTESIKRNSSDIIGRQEVQELLDNVKETHPVIVEEVLKVSNLGVIQKILQNLLHEQVSIRNLLSILEVIADHGERILNLDTLTEYVRQRLAKQISHQHMDEEGVIRIYALDPSLEKILEESLQEVDRNFVSTLDLEHIAQINAKLGDAMLEISKMGYPMIVLCSSVSRALLKQITERTLPGIVVLSYNEIVPEIRVEQMGVISLPQKSLV